MQWTFIYPSPTFTNSLFTFCHICSFSVPSLGTYGFFLNRLRVTGIHRASRLLSTQHVSPENRTLLSLEPEQKQGWVLSPALYNLSAPSLPKREPEGSLEAQLACFLSSLLLFKNRLYSLERI